MTKGSGSTSRKGRFAPSAREVGRASNTLPSLELYLKPRLDLGSSLGDAVNLGFDLCLRADLPGRHHLVIAADFGLPQSVCADHSLTIGLRIKTPQGRSRDPGPPGPPTGISGGAAGFVGATRGARAAEFDALG